MIAVINGQIGGTVTLFKAADAVLNVVLLDTDGSPLDITSDTIALEVQASKTRSDTPTKTVTGAIGVATGGFATVTLTDIVMDFGPGTFYGWIKRTEDSSGDISFGADYITLVVK